MPDAAAIIDLPVNASTQPRKSYPPGPRSGLIRVSPLTQALDLKDVAYRKAKDDSTPVHIAAALMRAWADLHEITMAIRGQGKPKPVEARNATPKRKPAREAPIAYPAREEIAPTAVAVEPTSSKTGG